MVKQTKMPGALDLEVDLVSVGSSMGGLTAAIMATTWG